MPLSIIDKADISIGVDKAKCDIVSYVKKAHYFNAIFSINSRSTSLIRKEHIIMSCTKKKNRHICFIINKGRGYDMK